MFNFFDNQKNPLMYMMNMMNTESTRDAEGPEKEAVDAELAELLKQAFGMQMQMMGMMCTMQMQFMQGVAGIMGLNRGTPDAPRPEPDASAGQPGGFQLGGVEIPPQLLARLMQMDMSPENLSKLQKALDFLFEAMPQQNRGE